MSVYSEIIAWSENQPLWQRDALRRLAKGPLLKDDFDALTKMCEQETSGVALAPAAFPIDPTHVPASTGIGDPVYLSGVSNTKAVNALVDDQSLTFSSTGITIVYGDNGAGKSGYARVLRHACQARGQDTEILSNVFSTSPGTPSATVSFEVGGVSKQWEWSLTGNRPPDLARVAVFDSLAASKLVEAPNAIIWVPGGLDLLEHLARTAEVIRQRLESANAAIAQPLPLPQVTNGTKADLFLRTLNDNTKTTEIDALQLSAVDRSELARLEAVLATPDPAIAAGRLRQRETRFRALSLRINAIEQAFGKKGMAHLTELYQAYISAAKAERLLAKRTFEDSVLQGVGEGAWQTLWQAAESYAHSGATQDKLFPSATHPAHCVLCQQTLDVPTLARMKRFHEFVRSDVSRRRSNAVEALERELTNLRSVRTSEVGDAGVVAELSEIDAKNGQNLASWLRSAQTILSAIGALKSSSSSWNLPDPIPTGWAVWLERLAKDDESKALTLGQAVDPATRSAQIRIRDELRSREALIQGRDQVEAEIKRLSKRAKLSRAIGACGTAGITRKSGELTKRHVSDRLVAQFNTEATALRLPHNVAYRPTGNSKGTSYQQMTLVAAQWAAKVGQPVRVLSEGERRSVALAAFLAEVGTQGDMSAVVLDDPVSSLDHDRRRNVAERLAEVARMRQVVVFTHDLVFLHMLKTAAKGLEVAVTDREIRRAGNSTGYCRPKAPAKAMTVAALVGELNAHAQHCATLHRTTEHDAYKRDLTQGYGLLREAWERAVEELLFNQSVMRFGHTVQTNRLKKVQDLTKSDFDTIEAGMTVCSKWLPGHAQATALNEPLPSPADFTREVKRLEAFASEMKKRGRN